MKTELVQCSTWRTAKRRCPWSCKIVRVEGGFRCFESVTDYRVWRNQR